MVLESEEEGEGAEEEVRAELEDEEVHILSLHALYVVDMSFHNQTMKLVGYYKKKRG